MTTLQALQAFEHSYPVECEILYERGGWEAVEDFARESCRRLAIWGMSQADSLLQHMQLRAFAGDRFDLDRSHPWVSAVLADRSLTERARLAFVYDEFVRRGDSLT